MAGFGEAKVAFANLGRLRHAEGSLRRTEGGSARTRTWVPGFGDQSPTAERHSRILKTPLVRHRQEAGGV